MTASQSVAEHALKTVVGVDVAVDCHDQFLGLVAVIEPQLDEFAAIEFRIGKMEDTKTNAAFFDAMKR